MSAKNVSTSTTRPALKPTATKQPSTKAAAAKTEKLIAAMEAGFQLARIDEKYFPRATLIRAVLLESNCYKLYEPVDPKADGIQRTRAMLHLAIDWLNDEDIYAIERAVMALAANIPTPEFKQRRTERRATMRSKIDAQIAAHPVTERARKSSKQVA